MNLTAVWSRVAEGQEATFRPRGNSMRGLVESGDEVTVVPCESSSLEPGDIVLVRVRGATYLHLVRARQGDRIQIGNNRGGTNGWVNDSKAVGICAVVAGRERDVAGKTKR